MKSVTASLLFVIVASLGVVLCSQQAESQDKQQTTPDNKINSLLAERRDTFRLLVEEVNASFKVGQTSLKNVLHMRNELLGAELEMTKTNAERIRIRKEQVKNFREIENEVKRLFNVGRATNDEMLIAKAARLEAEINLLRE